MAIFGTVSVNGKPLLVFVFGTLKEGFPNFDKNQGKRIVGDFVTTEKYPLHLVGDRNSPWMIDEKGEGLPINGQVFEVSQEALNTMDTLERVDKPDGYMRATIEVRNPETGKVMDVYAYLKPKELWDEKTMSKLGPFDEYTLEHASLYSKREE